MSKKATIISIIIILALGIWYFMSKSAAIAPETENMLIDDGTPIENPNSDMINDVSNEQGGDFEGITP